MSEPVRAATDDPVDAGVRLPRAVVPLVASSLAVAGLVLIPRWTATALPLVDAVSLLRLPGTAQPCTDPADRACAQAPAAPRTAARVLSDQLHALGLHDQGTTCRPDGSIVTRGERCEVWVRDGASRAVVVAVGGPGQTWIRLSVSG